MAKTFRFIDDKEDRFDALSPFLKAAYLAIAIAARPLHAKEIVGSIDRFSLYGDELVGLTPEKTLNARMSENILSEGARSLFCRTGPNTFSLRHLERTEDALTRYETTWHIKRERGTTDENVLVAPYHDLKKIITGRFTGSNEVAFGDINEISFFMHRPEAEANLSVKQFVTYTLVRNGDRHLVFRRGSYSNPSENLQGRLSIAFGGHVTDSDFDLFSDGEQAFLNNSSRELLEELSISSEYASIDDVSLRSRIEGYINVDDNSDARQHIAIVVLVDHKSDELPQSGELGITEVSWYSVEQLIECRSHFDLWSRYIIDRIEEAHAKQA